ncbi:MAG: glycosyltransferase family 87 protein [Candidatus Zixiibacteriota bacterium]
MISLRNNASRIRLVLMALLLTYLIGNISRHSGWYHWDFSTYYHAANVWAAGGDPYDSEAIKKDGGSANFPFLYPPVVLLFFWPFTIFSLNVALQVWLFLRVLLLIPLILLWWRWFVPTGRDWLFGLFLIIAFWGPIYLDLRAGNVTIVEQLLLWIGLALFLKKRWLWFCVCVVTAAIFKGTPLLFLGLLALPGVQHRIKLMLGSIGLFGFLHGVGYMMNPAQFAKYAKAALTWDERGKDFNPSTLAALKDVWDPLRARGVPPIIVDALTFAAYAAAVAVVLWFSWKAYRRLVALRTDEATSETDRLAVLIMLATLVCALVVPRLKVYTLMMILPVTYYVIRTEASRGALLLWMILLSMSNHTFLPIDAGFISSAGLYYPLLMLYLVWGVWTYRIIRSPASTVTTLEPAEASPADSAPI